MRCIANKKHIIHKKLQGNQEWSKCCEKKIWRERERETGQGDFFNSNCICDWFSFHVPSHTLFLQDFWKRFWFTHSLMTVVTVPDCHRTKTSFHIKKSSFHPSFLFYFFFSSGEHLWCILWLLYTYSFMRSFTAAPLLTLCKSTLSARHWSLSHQISPCGRERRKVQSLCSECSDLWTLANAHLSECDCVWQRGVNQRMHEVCWYLG